MNREYAGCSSRFLTISLRNALLATVYAAPLISIKRSGKDGSHIVTNWEKCWLEMEDSDKFTKAFVWLQRLQLPSNLQPVGWHWASCNARFFNHPLSQRSSCSLAQADSRPRSNAGQVLP